MRIADVIIVGSGIIGLSLAIALRKRGVTVLLVERGEPARESSHAAAGMLADHPAELPPPLQPLAAASGRMYPEFVHELQDESGLNVDLRDYGTLLVASSDDPNPAAVRVQLLSAFEPVLHESNHYVRHISERSVDPRALGAAALQAARHREVAISHGTAVTEVCLADGRVAGVRTEGTTYFSPAVVNCAGAWAGQMAPLRFPTRPVKGQMLSVVGAPPIRHVIRASEVYLVPRTDGRLLIGATVEEAGFDKRTHPDVIHRLHQAALRLIPEIAQARVHEAWAGLRPGTPDNLPLLGATEIPGYYVAAGHFRDGILLAPVTAEIMAAVVTGDEVRYDLSAFSPQRFPA